MTEQKRINSRSFLFLILFLFSTSLISLKTLKKVSIYDVRIFGTKYISQDDLEKNSSIKFPIRLIFIKTSLLEKELTQNLSLKNVSVSRQIFPFGLKVHANTRKPIAYGMKIVNNKKISGFIDKDGVFIKKQHLANKDLNKLSIQVIGWKEKFKKTLSKIFISQEDYKFEILRITFSPNGFLTIEEKDLKTIFLGFNPNLINYQLQIINNLKNEYKKNNFSKKIDNVDLTDPNKPKIKVFKP